VNKKEGEEEEIFDIFSSYLEKIENKEKSKNENFEMQEHKKIGLKETLREVINLAKKERAVLGVVAIEIILTFILVLMLAGFLPLF